MRSLSLLALALAALALLPLSPLRVGGRGGVRAVTPDPAGAPSADASGAVAPLTALGTAHAREAAAPTARAGRRTVRLRAVDAASGAPLVGAEVLSWSAPCGVLPDDRPARRVTPCAADGRWSGTVAPDTPLVVRAPDHAPRDVGGLEPGPDGVVVAALLPSHRRTVELRVVDEDGAPVAGARLEREDRAGPSAGHPALADGAGRLRVRLAGAGPSLRFAGTVRAEGFCPRAFSALSTGSGRLVVQPTPGGASPGADGTLVLERAGTVEGTVRDAGGRPLGGVRVLLARAGESSSDGTRGAREARACGTPGGQRWCATTDRTGRFRVDDVPLEARLVRRLEGLEGATGRHVEPDEACRLELAPRSRAAWYDWVVGQEGSTGS